MADPKRNGLFIVFSPRFVPSLLGRPFASALLIETFERIGQSHRIAELKWLSFHDWFLATDGRMFVNDVHIQVYVSLKDVPSAVYCKNIPGKIVCCQKFGLMCRSKVERRSESDCTDTISRPSRPEFGPQFRPVEWLIVFVCVSRKDAPAVGGV